MTMVQLPLTKYTLVARILHWLIAAGVITAFGIAISIDGQPLHTKFLLINYHKWVGISVLGLVTIRLLWRLTHRPPALPDHMAPWERTVAHVGHALLYLLMFCVPLAGWMFSSAAGYQVVWLGLVPLPNLVDKNRALAHLIGHWHGLGGYALIIVASLHALAGLKHHFIDRDDVLRRML